LIIPEPPAATSDIPAWLAGFLEGLGTSTVRILAAGDYGIPALELALMGSDQVARIVLIADGPETPEAGRGLLGTATGRSSVPLLVVRSAGRADDLISLVIDFLAEETAAPA
jgi:hypothetical protein